MSQLYLVNSLLIGSVAINALTVMVYWHRATGGAWRWFAAGRTQMHLLAIVFLITGVAAVQTLIPAPLIIRAGFYFLLYIAFDVALIRIGLNIRAEVRRGRCEAASTPSNSEEVQP